MEGGQEHSKEGAEPGLGGESQGHQRPGNVDEQAGWGCRQPESRWGGETLMPTLVPELRPWIQWKGQWGAAVTF